MSQIGPGNLARQFVGFFNYWLQNFKNFTFHFATGRP